MHTDYAADLFEHVRELKRFDQHSGGSRWRFVFEIRTHITGQDNDRDVAGSPVLGKPPGEAAR